MIATWLATLALTACVPAASTFPSSDTGATAIRGALFRPDGDGPFPAVVLLPACGGAQRSHVRRTWPDYLTRRGYVVMTVATFESRGYGTCDRAGRHEWPTHQAMDAYGALDHLAAQPFVDARRVAVVGFSAGGFAINERIVPMRMGEGRAHDFKAAIAVYAGCWRLGFSYGDDEIPLLQIAAEHDHRLVGSCVRVAQDTPMETHVIEGAYHAFDQSEIKGIRSDNAGNPMSFSPGATDEAMRVAVAFLARHLGHD